jgi:hypothetical protein
MRDALRVLRVDVSALRVIKEADILNAELNKERLVKNQIWKSEKIVRFYE